MAEATLRLSQETSGACHTFVMAGMSYLGILCFVPLLMNRNEEYVLFHAKQGLVLWAWAVLAMFTLHIPGIGEWLFAISSMTVAVLSVAGLLSVAFRRAWKLPLVGYLSAKI